MDWRLDKSRPISKQICEKICVAVASGEYRSGEKLLSVREVALLARVNPNTVQKSFEELERCGVIHSVRSSGWFVGEDVKSAQEQVNELRLMHSREYLRDMSQLGCDEKATIDYLKKLIEEKGESI